MTKRTRPDNLAAFTLLVLGGIAVLVADFTCWPVAQALVIPLLLASIAASVRHGRAHRRNGAGQ